jgi:hypothetical protein
MVVTTCCKFGRPRNPIQQMMLISILTGALAATNSAISVVKTIVNAKATRRRILGTDVHDVSYLLRIASAKSRGESRRGGACSEGCTYVQVDVA